MDITEFLKARLDEDEAIAENALWSDDSAEWTAFRRDPEKSDGRWVIIDRYEEGVTEVRPQAADDEGVARHIVRFDPARALRDVEAKRAILEEHAAADVPHVAWRGCLTCKDPSGWPQTCPCRTVRQLAAVYNDHPDYEPVWAPQ